MTSTTRLLVVDAMNLVFRAHYALITRPLRTTDGRNTSAIFGVGRMLLKAIGDFSPTHVAVAFEGGGPTFRDELYPQYKATRKAPPDDLIQQLEPIKELVRALGLTSLEVPGAEADDVVATLAGGGVGRFDEVLILSGDKDLMALVGGGVRMLVPKTGVSDLEVMDAAAVQAKMGVPPPAVPDLLALMGDSVDNVPGVRGVGEKGARKLLAKYGSLASVYEHLGEVEPPRTRAALEGGKADAALSLKLVTLKSDLKLRVAPAGLVPRRRDDRALGLLVREYELKTLADDLRLDAEPADDLATAEGTFSSADFRRGAVPAAACLAVEPVSRQRKLTGLVVAAAGGVRFLEGDGASLVGQLAALNQASPAPLVAHDTKALTHLLGAPGVPFDGDTLLAAYLLNPERAAYRLEDLAFEYLKTQLPAGPPEGELDFGAGDEEGAAARVRAVAALAPLLETQLAAYGMEDLYRSLEVPLAPVLAAMENRGVRIDRAHFGRLAGLFEKEIEKAEGELYELAGGPFNANSPVQLREVLFDKLALKPKRKTKTGYSTAADVLEQLADEHPLPAKVLAYRELTKLKNTYVDVLPTLADAAGRVHTTLNQTGAATGRLSSQDPNLQNIPIRTELGGEIRKGFVAADGMVLVSADYAQVELRVLAHIADDAGLQEAFAAGQDIHAATASRIFDVPFEKVTREHRAIAKAINFGLAYKMGARRLARDAGITVADATRFVEEYFEHFPGVRRFMDDVIDFARRDGYVHTVLGRRRYLPEIQSPDNRARAAAERVAVNTPIQGTAADILKLAMVAVEKRVRAEGLASRMILTIHDELLFEAPPAEVERLSALAREEMTAVVQLKVPLEVHVGTGYNWLEAHG